MQKSNNVTPAKAGVQNLLKTIDSGSRIAVRDKFRRNDKPGVFRGTLLLFICLNLISCGSAKTKENTIRLTTALPDNLKAVQDKLVVEAKVGKDVAVGSREENQYVFAFDEEIPATQKDLALQIYFEKKETCYQVAQSTVAVNISAPKEISASIAAEGIDTALDCDKDGLTNLSEVVSGLLPDDSDTDDDTCVDGEDAFPKDQAECVDLDVDGTGDNADLDDDGDGLSDLEEIDRKLDPRNSDSDSDTINDGSDNCPHNELKNQNKDQKDNDKDGDGDVCDTDDDNDGLSDDAEGLLGTNAFKTDTDGDGWSDTEEEATKIKEPRYRTNPLKADTDGDGVSDPQDAFASDNAETKDADDDTVGDNADNCVAVANVDQTNTDRPSEVALLGDACDEDDDGDGALDTEEEGLGRDGVLTKRLVADSDGDGIKDGADNCPTVPNSDQRDVDGDGFGFVADRKEGDDGDGDRFLDCDCNDDPAANGAAFFPTATDEPDIRYRDLNCDGVDGSIHRAVFVDPLRGDDNGVGSKASPVRTLRVGMQRAAQAGKDVYVGAGTYDASGLDWNLGLKLYGGFRVNDAGNPFGEREVRSTDGTFQTVLKRQDADVTLALVDLNRPLLLSGFHLQNEGTEQDSTKGVRTVVIRNATVDLFHNTIVGNAKATTRKSIGVSVEPGSILRMEGNWVDVTVRGRATAIAIVLEGSDTVSLMNNLLFASSSRATTGLEIRNTSPLVVNNTIRAVSPTPTGLAKGVVLNGSPAFVLVNNAIRTERAADQYVVECVDGPLNPTRSARFQNNLLAADPPNSNPALLVNCDGDRDSDADGEGLIALGETQMAGNIDFDAGDVLGVLLRGAGLDASSVTYGAVKVDYSGEARRLPYDIGHEELP